MTNEPTLIEADALVTMDRAGTVFSGRAGVVVEEGLIRDLGAAAELRSKWGHLRQEKLAGTLLPGFINAHTHLELGYQRGVIERPTHFTAWVGALMKNYPPADRLETLVAASVRDGARESLLAGVTTLADISRHPSLTRRELARLPIRAISFGEVVGLGKMRSRWEPMLDHALDRQFQTPRLTVGISPHAPYTVEGPTLQEITQRALREAAPLSMHLGELAEEREFLATLGGKLGREWDVMQKLDVLDDLIPTCPDGAIAWAQRWGLLAAAAELPVLLAHVNYCDPAELAMLATSRAGVIYCPRTHAYFGHPPTHRYRQMRDAGIPVALGTDSLASNPDLDLRNEAQWLWQRDNLDPCYAMEMITRIPGEMLRLPAGVLQPGFFADLALFDAAGPSSAKDLCAHVLAGAPVRAVWVAGERVV